MHVNAEGTAEVIAAGEAHAAEAAAAGEEHGFAFPRGEYRAHCAGRRRRWR